MTSKVYTTAQVCGLDDLTVAVAPNPDLTHITNLTIRSNGDGGNVHVTLSAMSPDEAHRAIAMFRTVLVEWGALLPAEQEVAA